MLLLLVEFYPTFNFLIKWYCIRNWSTPLSIYVCIGACGILQEATSWNKIQHNWDYFIFLMGVDLISWMYCPAFHLAKKSKFGYRLVTNSIVEFILPIFRRLALRQTKCYIISLPLFDRVIKSNQ